MKKKLYLMFAILFISFNSVYAVETSSTLVLYNYFSEDILTAAKNNNTTLVLVASGFSESSLGRMYKKVNLEKQRRSFAMSYLWALKAAKRGISVRLFYLTTTRITASFRKYLYILSHGSEDGFELFEAQTLKLFRFSTEDCVRPDQPHQPGDPKQFEYLKSGDNAEVMINLRKALVHMHRPGENVHFLGLSAHYTGWYLENLAKDLQIPFLLNPSEHFYRIKKSQSRIAYHRAGLKHARGTYRPVFNLDDLAKDTLTFNHDEQNGCMIHGDTFRLGKIGVSCIHESRDQVKHIFEEFSKSLYNYIENHDLYKQYVKYYPDHTVKVFIIEKLMEQEDLPYTYDPDKYHETQKENFARTIKRVNNVNTLKKKRKIKGYLNEKFPMVYFKKTREELVKLLENNEELNKNYFINKKKVEGCYFRRKDIGLGNVYIVCVSKSKKEEDNWKMYQKFAKKSLSVIYRSDIYYKYLVKQKKVFNRYKEEFALSEDQSDVEE